MLLLTAREVIFFFQAEDGIRDKLVTGVQTCALPISPRPSSTWPTEKASSSLRLTTARGIRRPGTSTSAPTLRSEERRVGKECRSPWSPHRYKKKDTRRGRGGGPQNQPGRVTLEETTR